MAHKWRLPASGGNAELSAVFAYDSDRGPVYSVQLRGLLWSRSRDVPSDSADNEYLVSIPQLLLSREKMTSLADRLYSWLETPVELEITISEELSQTLTLNFGSNDELITSYGKTAVTISYRSDSFTNGQWAYVVDYSCIRIFADSLMIK